MDGISPSNDVSPLLAANVSVVAPFVEKAGVCFLKAINGAQKRVELGRTNHTRGRTIIGHEIHSTPNQRGIPRIMVTAPANPPTPPRKKLTMSSNHLSPPPRVIPSPQPCSFATPPRQTSMMAYRHAQCTHLTMVRLYTSELRCSVCLRVPSMGWLYRCSQDRELLLEQGVELGIQVSMSPVE